MKRAAKVDSNQAEITAAFRKAGAVVVITSQLKNAFDLIVCHRGKVYLVEVKDGSKPPSARKLTEGEEKCRDLVESAGVKYNVVTSIDDALKMLNGISKT